MLRPKTDGVQGVHWRPTYYIIWTIYTREIPVTCRMRACIQKIGLILEVEMIKSTGFGYGMCHLCN